MTSLSSLSSLVVVELLGLSACTSSPATVAPKADASLDARLLHANDAGSVSRRDAAEPDGRAVDAAAPGTMTQVTLGSLVFDVRVDGPSDGEPVMLLHGFPETSFEWRHQMAFLAARGYRVIAPDQRGYSPGARPTDVAEYGVVKLIQDVNGIADALGAPRFHLVGHDWGAGVAWGLAGLFSNRVITFTAISIPHPDAFKQVLADQTTCQYADSSYFDFFQTDAAVGFFIDNDAQGLEATYPGVPASDVNVYVKALGNQAAITAALDWYRANIKDRQFTVPTLGPVSVPTLMVWSDQDSYICRAGIDLTRSFVKAPYHLAVLSGVNHWVPENAADALDALLLAHFRGQDGG